MPKYKNHTKTQTIVSQILLHRIISKIKAQIYLYVAYHQPAILFTRFFSHWKTNAINIIEWIREQ